MARIDTARFGLDAVRNIQIADSVRRDPAVVKAAKQFRDDGLQVVKSGGILVRETGESWRRNS